MKRWFRAHTMQLGLAGLILGAAILLLVLIFSNTQTVAAAPKFQGEKPSDETCLACHQQEGMTAQIGGHSLPITIDGSKFAASVHVGLHRPCSDDPGFAEDPTQCAGDYSANHGRNLRSQF